MDEITLHPSKGSGVQADPSPESKLESEEGKRASFSAGLRDLKERMFLFGSSCGLSPVFKSGCWPAFPCHSGHGVVWRWAGALTRWGCSHVFEESGKALIQCERHCPREQQEQEGAYACSVRRVTILTRAGS